MSARLWLGISLEAAVEHQPDFRVRCPTHAATLTTALLPEAQIPEAVPWNTSRLETRTAAERPTCNRALRVVQGVQAGVCQAQDVGHGRALDVERHRHPLVHAHVTLRAAECRRLGEACDAHICGVGMALVRLVCCAVQPTSKSGPAASPAGLPSSMNSTARDALQQVQLVCL